MDRKLQRWYLLRANTELQHWYQTPSYCHVYIFSIKYVCLQAGRFGSGLVVLDINLDGYNDIVVSSPNVGWANLTYTVSDIL